MASGRACIAEVEVVLACQSSYREESLECFGVFCTGGGGGFPRGITFCSFQLDSTFFEHSAWRIEVSPSRIGAYTLQLTVTAQQVIDNLSEVLDGRKITAAQRPLDLAAAKSAVKIQTSGGLLTC